MNLKVVVKESDFVEACKIHNQIPEFDKQEEKHFVERCKDKKSLVLVASVDKKLAGYIIAYDKFSDRSIYLWMAGVVPEYREKGVFSKLYEKLVEWTKKNEFDTIKIKTRNSRRQMLLWLAKNDFLFTHVETREPIQENRISAQKTIITKEHL